ncbi:MAG: efflux RND transporter periplasmic adaptor subunit [Candidatus Dormibacterales bacterium]
MRRRVLVVLVIVAGLLGGSIVYAQASRVTTTYRTALVTYGTITQTIGMAGNLQPVSQANLNFASSGTVQTVSVQVGQTVAAGATLAALDPTLLSAQLLQAQATLASAQAKLAQDQAGPSASSLASGQNAVASAQVSVNNAQTSYNDAVAINAPAVAAATTTVNADQATLNTDQSAMAAACVVNPSVACTNATNLVGTDQTALATAKSNLAKAQQPDDQAAASLASAQQQLASARSSLAAQQVSAPAPTIEMDTAQIEIDQVNVNTVQHELDGATITSPIGGVVSQVNIAAGQNVTGGSSSASSSSYAIVVYTPGSYEMTGTVSDAQVNLVAIGQTVQVTPAGSTQALLGKVTSIAPAATVTSGVASFGVTAQLSDASNAIKPGTSATASIVVNQVVHVLTVPTSSVHTTGAGSTVLVMSNGSPISVAIQTGASDPTRTEITAGLKLNQVVVIAVITSSVPSSGTGTALGAGGTRGGGGGGGTFRGGGG